jgi:hypothetical protein
MDALLVFTSIGLLAVVIGGIIIVRERMAEKNH